MTEHWYETARPGDMFVGRDGRRCMVTAVTAKGLGYVFEDRTHGGWLHQSHLTECKPLHVENMRRHVAAVLLGMHSGAVVDLYGVEVLRGDGASWSLDGCYDTVQLDEAVEAIVPDDWTPPGGEG